MALTTNIIAYYKFDENTGTIVSDATGNNNAGTWGGGIGTQWATGIINSAGSFTSAGGYAFVRANITNLPQAANARTLAFWMYGASFGGNDTYIAYGQASGSKAFGLQINGGTSIHFEGWFYDADHAFSFSTATWYHVGITFDGTDLISYVNGTAKGTTNRANMNTSGSILNFGTNITGNAPMNGRIDECGVWTRALSGAEMGSLYNGGVGMQYPFGEGAIPLHFLSLLGAG